VDGMVNLNRVEKEVLLQLLDNCAQPISEIASKVGATRQTVSKKMKCFVDSGIVQSFSTRLNPESLGLGLRALILIKEEPKSDFRTKNEEALKGLKQIAGFYYIFGRHDVVLEVFVEGNEELTNLVKEIHKLDGVKETETMIIHSVVKDKREDTFIRVLQK